MSGICYLKLCKKLLSYFVIDTLFYCLISFLTAFNTVIIFMSFKFSCFKVNHHIGLYLRFRRV